MAALSFGVAAVHDRAPPALRAARYLKERGYHDRLAHFVLASEGLAQTCEAVHWALQESKSTPDRKRSITKEKIPALVLVAINTIVFTSWQAAELLEMEGLDNWMIQYFSYTPISAARDPHTVLTSVFSHSDLIHLSGNMFTLWMFAPQVVRLLGYRGFAYFYVGSAYAKDLFEQIIFSRIAPKQNAMMNEVGASGSISAVQILYCLSFPSNKFKIKDTALSAPLAALIWVIQDMWQLNDNYIGHGVHLSGYLFAFLVWGWRHVEEHGMLKVYHDIISRLIKYMEQAFYWLIYNMEQVLNSSVEEADK